MASYERERLPRANNERVVFVGQWVPTRLTPVVISWGRKLTVAKYNAMLRAMERTGDHYLTMTPGMPRPVSLYEFIQNASDIASLANYVNKDLNPRLFIDRNLLAALNIKESRDCPTFRGKAMIDKKWDGNYNNQYAVRDSQGRLRQVLVSDGWAYFWDGITPAEQRQATEQIMAAYGEHRQRPNIGLKAVAGRMGGSRQVALSQMASYGIDSHNMQPLLNLSKALRRWHEAECNGSIAFRPEGCYEADLYYQTRSGKLVKARRNGYKALLLKFKKFMAMYPQADLHIQTDPRGNAIYFGKISPGTFSI